MQFITRDNVIFGDHGEKKPHMKYAYFNDVAREVIKAQQLNHQRS